MSYGILANKVKSKKSLSDTVPTNWLKPTKTRCIVAKVTSNHIVIVFQLSSSNRAYIALPMLRVPCTTSRRSNDASFAIVRCSIDAENRVIVF